jgi:hypothetical protein
MSTPFNPFSVLLNPAGILTQCADSGVLETLPLSAKHCADRQSPAVAGEVAQHDAALEAIYQELIAKAAKAPVAKPKRTRSAEAA